MSTRQLAMVESSDTAGTRDGTDPARWHLDAHTRRIGLAGVAEGRRILREAAARQAAREAQARPEQAGPGHRHSPAA